MRLGSLAAVSADLRVCAQCGRAIAMGSAVAGGLPAVWDGEEWFCDRVCEARCEDTPEFGDTPEPGDTILS